MADRLLGVLRHQALELDLGLLVFEMGGSGPGVPPNFDGCPIIRSSRGNDEHDRGGNLA